MKLVIIVSCLFMLTCVSTQPVTQTVKTERDLLTVNQLADAADAAYKKALLTGQPKDFRGAAAASKLTVQTCQAALLQAAKRIKKLEKTAGYADRWRYIALGLGFLVLVFIAAVFVRIKQG